MQIQTNQQEKTAAHQALEELTTKAKLEYRADHASLAAMLVQILELIEAKWPATQDTPKWRDCPPSQSSPVELPIPQPRAVAEESEDIARTSDTDEELSEEVMCAGSNGNGVSTVQATKTMRSWEWDGGGRETLQAGTDQDGAETGYCVG